MFAVVLIIIFFICLTLMIKSTQSEVHNIFKFRQKSEAETDILQIFLIQNFVKIMERGNDMILTKQKNWKKLVAIFLVADPMTDFALTFVELWNAMSGIANVKILNVKNFECQKMWTLKIVNVKKCRHRKLWMSGFANVKIVNIKFWNVKKCGDWKLWCLGLWTSKNVSF